MTDNFIIDKVLISQEKGNNESAPAPIKQGIFEMNDPNALLEEKIFEIKILIWFFFMIHLKLST